MIDLTVKIDNDEAKKKLEELRQTAKQTTSSIVTDAERMDEAMRFRPQIDKKAAKDAEKAMQAIAEAMPLNIGATPLAGIEETLTHLPEKANASAGGFNNLNFATQQLVREVPAATMGLHMFFLAISNNLPFFADAIKQVREENKALAASGKPTVGVFKQIIGSLFNWQTVLVLGVTALTMYGKEIGNWVKGLFKGKSAVDAVKEATEGLNASIEKNGLGTGQELGKYESLRREFKAINGDLKEQERFVRDNQAAFDDLGVSVNSVVDAESFFSGEGTEAFLTALRLRAEAMAAQKLAVEQYEKAIIAEADKANAEIELQSIPQYITQNKATSGGAYAPMSYGGSQLINSDYTSKKEEIANLDAEAKSARSVADAYFDMHDAKMKAASDTLEDANIKQNAQQTQAELRAAEEQKRKAEAALAEAKREAEERKRAIQRLNNDLSKEVQRTQREMDDAEIATIKDGIERKQREIQAGYERRAAEIDKYEADIKAAQGGELTPEQKGHISYLRQANTDTLMAGKVLIKAMQDEAAQEAVDAMNEYLASYGTFQERLVAITAKYSRLIADAQTEGERKTLEYERDAILAEYEVQASDWAKKLVDKTAEQLTTMADKLQSVLDGLQTDYDALDTSDSEEAKQLLQTINMLKAQIKVLKERLGDASKAANDDNWAEATQVFQNISSTATEAASALSEMDPALGKIFSGLANIAEIGGDAVSALNALSTAASAVDKASAVLMVISVAIKAISTITTGVTKTIREHEEAMFALTQVAQQYKIALEDIAFQEERMVYSSIFGDDKFGEFNALIEKANEYKAALEDVREEANKIVDYGKNLSQSETEYLRMRAAIDVFDNSKLIADMRSGWQKFVGSTKNIEVTALDEFYENGVLNIDKLKAYYDNYKDYLNKEQQLLVEKLIAAGEQYEEASKEATDYLTDIFGDFGETMTDILVGSFKEGTDAAQGFGDAMSDIVERLTKEFIYSAFIKDFVDDAQAQVDALNDEEISGEEKVKRLVELLKQLSNDVLGAQDEVSATLEQLENEGYGMEDSSRTQSRYSSGFQAMSQETGSELNGRFTDIQGQTHRISEAVEFMKGMSVTQLQQTASISETVAMIHNDTTRIEQHTRVLYDMNDKLGRIIQNTEYL